MFSEGLSSGSGFDLSKSCEDITENLITLILTGDFMNFKCFCGKKQYYKYDFRECENCFNADWTSKDRLFCKFSNTEKKYIREHDQYYIHTL